MNNDQKSNKLGKKKKSKDIGTCIIIGFTIGALFDIITGNIALWAGMGMCVSIVITAFSGA